MFSQVSQFFHFIRNLDRQAQIQVGITSFGLVWIVTGLVVLVQGSQGQVEVVETSSAQMSNDLGQVTVDVSGAVEKPGMYPLKYGARIGEAIAAAGGVSAQADPAAFAKNINLAEKLSDGQKVYIPFQQVVAQVDGQSEKESGTEAESSEEDELISVNTASLKELESLPGIGAKKAADLVAGRPFLTMEAVRAVVKVSERQWAELQKVIQL